MTNIPNAVVIDSWPNRTYPGHYIIEVRCPYCTKTHTHGVQSLTAPAGHRAAHCSATMHNPGYFVAFTEEPKPGN